MDDTAGYVILLVGCYLFVLNKLFLTALGF